jgi:hypothetical protein
MRIAGYRESRNEAYTLNRVLSLGSFTEEIVIFNFLCRSLKGRERLVECQGERNTSEVLSTEGV